MERLIKFPLPEYCNCFDSVQNLIRIPYCLCYQYDIDNNGYGPYGFKTFKAKSILEKVFNNLYYWNNNQIIEYNSLDFRSGLYFYNEPDWVKLKIKEISSYHIKVKKDILLRKKNGTALLVQTSPPHLIRVYDGLFKTDILNELLISNINFFISIFFTPEAGQSFIFFDHTLLSEILQIAKENGISLTDISSIEKLAPW